MSTQREVMQQALEALDLLDEYDITRAMLTDEAMEQVWATADAATDALRAALAQQEQEPVAWSDARLRGIAGDYFPDAKDWPAAMLCLRHLLMEQAKYPLALSRVPLAQQEQEPLSVEDLARALVASRVIDAAAIDDPEGYDDGVMLDQVRGLHRRLAALAQQAEPVGTAGDLFTNTALERLDLRPSTKVYTHPPRREWRGLRDEEIRRMGIETPGQQGGWNLAFARAIEAALKERNT